MILSGKCNNGYGDNINTLKTAYFINQKYTLLTQYFENRKYTLGLNS